ncbi:hypothetical protein [Burkholderia gladioli]|uniref:hypothetical protein n=1 Tax=Burkholderia gladioli TaxID=28095 RepID=UPI0016415876|nr:hypothetical protein [Burkholderia gladioli]
MTNNTTAALTDDEREKLIDLVDRLIRNPDAVSAKDCIIGNDVRTVQWIAEHTRALLTSPRAAVPAPKGWKMVPIERSYNMRAKALIAFNTTEKKTNDRDDALDAAHRAMLDAAPAAPAAPVEDVAPNVVEAIAEQWDGCMYAAPGIDIDIGEAIRQAATRFAAKKKRRPFASSAQAVAADGALLVRNLSPLERVEEDIVVMTRMSNDTKRLPMEETESLARLLYYIEDLRRAAVSPATDDCAVPDAIIRKIATKYCEYEAGNQSFNILRYECEEDLFGCIREIVGARAAVSPATAEPCAHDYVRTDRVCTECGEKTATADEPAAFDFDVLREYLRQLNGAFSATLDSGYAPGSDAAKKARSQFYKTMSSFEALIDTLARASQAAAPAEARESSVVASGLIGLARHVRAVPAYSKLVGDMDIVDQAIAILNGAPAEAREPHSDDIAVDAFAAAMKAKMAASRAKGRGGWETCTPSDLSRMLREHVEKGDPRDVANFCMMLHHHGASISGAADAGEAADATRYRWLQRQRAKVWHEIADLPINHTNEYIDAAIAADGHSAQGGKGGEA